MTTKRAIVYLRVSTAGQASDGVSLDMQKAKARAWCELHDYEFNDDLVFIDAGISGTSTENREAFKLAIETAKAGDAFVVYSISRFGRNTLDILSNIAELEKRGIDFASTSEHTDTTTPQGKFFLTMMAGMAQLTSDTIKKTTKDAMQHAKKEGRLIGGVPYGFDAVSTGKVMKSGRTERKLTPNEYEQSVIKRVLELRANSKMSMQRIADQLHTEGFKSRSGETFQPMTISRILANSNF